MNSSELLTRFSKIIPGEVLVCPHQVFRSEEDYLKEIRRAASGLWRVPELGQVAYSSKPGL
jgi:hypothetical protein